MKPTMELATILQYRGMFHDKTKEDAEIVVTRFDENLEWISGLEHIVTVYNKGAEGIWPGATVINVPNYGVGLETILRHIITRYNSLADTTMFCQGALVDRPDQPMYPLEWYFDFDENDKKKGVKGVLTDSYDSPKSRFRSRISNDACKANKDRTLRDFREKVMGIPYKYLVEFWVRGDWISVKKDAIRKKPVEYYKYLYSECKFQRGIFVEECWFLEHSLYSLFTQTLRHSLVYRSEKEVLLV